MKKRYIIKKGKLIPIKSSKKLTKKPNTSYERYVNIAKGIGIPKSEIVNENEYITAVAGEKARGLPARPKDIAFKQKYQATERQTRIYWKAYKRTTADSELMTYKQFINAGYHHEMPGVVEERYNQLKEYYKDDLSSGRMSTTMLGHIISSEFFGS